MVWPGFWDAWASLGVLWRSLEEPWGPLGVSWEVHGHPWGPGNVLGASWGALGVILEVWGDPWVSPGRSTCLYFIGFRLIFEMPSFFNDFS